MDSLSEEILDHVVSLLKRMVGVRDQPDHQALLSMSLVSHRLHRITEPHLYHTLKLQPSNQFQLLRTAHARPTLLSHTQNLQLMGEPDQALSIDILPELRNFHVLDINVESFRGRTWIPFLHLASITKLFLRNITPSRMNGEDEIEWCFTNHSIKALCISFAEPNDDPWEDCDDIPKLTGCFPNLEYLEIFGSDNGGHKCELDGFVFRYLVYAFSSAFQTNLRGFEFWYHCEGILSAYVGMDEVISVVFDANNTLHRSKLRKLRLDTNCLLPYSTSDRSGTLTLSILPLSLHKVYLRHVVYNNNNLTEAGMIEDIYSGEETRCLVHLFEELAWLSKLPQLTEVMLALFVPEDYICVAIEVCRKHGGLRDVKFGLVIAPWINYQLNDIAKSWPEYNKTKDPRHALFDKERLRGHK
ncbi:hypothetical protein BKA66DRAFT_311236 [Pyrenochaeta sp. MPI-SDFR-AT-0127]|nr:hypothetical protein BKA66DRAFT_311236 [Pyrenochaeta sp. MPI-SDFR-AT-0127]